MSYSEGEKFGKKVFLDRNKTCHDSPVLCAKMLSDQTCDTITDPVEKNGCYSAITDEYKREYKKEQKK